LRESPVEWSAFAGSGEIGRRAPKVLREDQAEAVAAVRAGLAEADRGRLVMACGTGKTLTALRIAEELAGAGGRVLFLVPSLALMAQTVREWCADAACPLAAFAVCSDTQVGRRRQSRDDAAELEATDLAFPATTDPAFLARVAGGSDAASMQAVFATYQSIAVIETAQAEHGLPGFDLIVCDEAHRTTGATFPGEDQSHFVKVHDNAVIRGRKRLYMTATPRIYGESARSKAREAEAVLASMDDVAVYGEVLFHCGFARAVEAGILTDYRVVVLAMDEVQVSAAVQRRLTDSDSELVLDDATKIVGCWKALSKTGLTGSAADDDAPMRRALAFCRSIKASKLVCDEFEQVVREYRLAEGGSEGPGGVCCEAKHVDGSFRARERGRLLDWLEQKDAGDNVCRILSNARCLVEGVDVPALDAILFVHPRNSQIDVVQAVGRVMRRAEGKRMGYVILPVGIPHGVPAEVALGDNRRYRVIWQVVNALRAHDERLDAVVNQCGLGQDVGDRIAIIDGRELAAVTATADDLPARPAGREVGIGKGGLEKPESWRDTQQTMDISIDEFSRAVKAQLVRKCGRREYWDDWAKDVAEIAERHVARISALVRQPDSDARSVFEDFLAELRKNINSSIAEGDAIEMLAQHLVTRPVFEALFEGHRFVDRNPVSVAMTGVLSAIDHAQVGREAGDLEGFYASVRRRAAGITDPLAQQKLVVQLYEKFFKEAFPRTAQMLGIVYTPVEIVDFIIRSVNDALQDSFDRTLGSPDVHILDPFTGTGTFVTRLLQSGLIGREDMERKYREEIHANDIVLLAYYIAAVNIEAAYHSATGEEEYHPFEGICLADSFAMHEGDSRTSLYMERNSDRIERQREADIQVIVGNPPYSVGQKSEDDKAKNVAYPRLDERIRSTYAQRSSAGLKRNLYDSYIRAIRWGSDRLGETGVMAYVTNGAWVERSFGDGMRKCLAEEFSSIHVFHLRGDVNKDITSGGAAGEGENVFGQSSKTGVAITIFVKDKGVRSPGRIAFHDIGRDLSRLGKLKVIKNYGSIHGIGEAGGWTEIAPDEHGDWIDQRDSRFSKFPKMGDKRDRTGEVLFSSYTLGVSTGRDAWCINPSRFALTGNVNDTINFYNNELARFSHNFDTNSLHPPPG